VLVLMMGKTRGAVLGVGMEVLDVGWDMAGWELMWSSSLADLEHLEHRARRHLGAHAPR
jgi:hypothetical protein